MNLSEALSEIEKTVKNGYINWIDYMIHIERELFDDDPERKLIAEQKVLHCGASQKFWRENPQPRIRLLDRPTNYEI